jgi:hypothetical protein
MQVQERPDKNIPKIFLGKAEDFIFPDLCKPGLGLICEYCQISTGYSLRFSSLNQYLEHVLRNHDTWKYSVYAFPEELKRFEAEVAQQKAEARRKWVQENKVDIPPPRAVVDRVELTRLLNDNNMTTTGIAKKLGISVPTVSHYRRILSKERRI